MSDSLRSKLIRLAHTHPEFRDDLLPLLRSADQNAPSNWYGLEPKSPGITEPALLPPKTARVLSKMESMRRMQELRTEHGNGSRAFYETVLQEVKAGIIAPAAVVGGGYKNNKAVAIKWLTEQMQTAKSAAWENLPKGWTSDSVQSMWDTMTGDVKHKITKCMKEMEGKVDNTGAFCGSLASEVGYKRAANKAGDASLLRKAIIRVAHENPDLRTTLLPLLPRRA